MTDPQRPRTERGHALIEAVRGAVLDPAIATLLGSDGKQELVALVSLALLEADIPAIEAEASIAAPAGLREMLDEAESIIRQGTETAWLRLGYYRWQDVANDWLKRRAPLEAAPRSPEPPRRMLDGSPCWCVSEDEPHEGWVHAPVCLVRREIAADPNRRAHVEAVKVELAASCSSCGHLLAAHPLCCPDDMHLTADGKRLVWWDAAPRSPEPHLARENERLRVAVAEGDRRIERLRELIHPTLEDGYCPACAGGCLIGFATPTPGRDAVREIVP